MQKYQSGFKDADPPNKEHSADDNEININCHIRPKKGKATGEVDVVAPGTKNSMTAVLKEKKRKTSSLARFLTTNRIVSSVVTAVVVFLSSTMMLLPRFKVNPKCNKPLSNSGECLIL